MLPGSHHVLLLSAPPAIALHGLESLHSKKHGCVVCFSMCSGRRDHGLRRASRTKWASGHLLHNLQHYKTTRIRRTESIGATALFSRTRSPYKMVSKFLVFSTLFSLAFAKPTARSMKVREAIQSVPTGYVRTGAASADTELKLRIALVQNNPEGLIDELYSVSTPGGASYGEHLSKEEASTFVSSVSSGLNFRCSG